MQPKLFTELNINKNLKTALEAMHLSEMTPVQEQTIPVFLTRDVIVKSQTGSGKTLAYLIPVVNGMLDRGEKPTEVPTPPTSALIIVPTRELSSQVASIATSLGISSTVFIGGVPMEEDLKKPVCPLVIGTPGRLLEIISRDSRKFSKVKYLVLDESDKLLSLGFEEKLLKLLEFLPKGRRTGLFSATDSEEVAKFALSSLRSPVSIKITESLPSKLKLEYMVVEANRKVEALMDLVRGRKAIVFFSTCSCVNFYYELFRRGLGGLSFDNEVIGNVVIHDKAFEGDVSDCKAFEGDAPDNKMIEDDANKVSVPDNRISVPDKRVLEHKTAKTSPNGIYRIHGKMPQNERNEVYSCFEADGRLLVCTDVAARGIDFKDVEVVVHFDIPKDYTNIVHRSGRTARMGTVGEAVVFLMPNERMFVNFLKLKGIEAVELVVPERVVPERVADAVQVIESLATSTTSTNSPALPEDLLKLAVQAFVSYIRGYKEHVLNYILNYKELDFDALVELFRLVRIPSMTELKHVKFRKFEREEKEMNKVKRNKRK